MRHRSPPPSPCGAVVHREHRRRRAAVITISAVNGSGTKKLFTGNSAPTTQTNFTLTSGRPVQAFSGPYATKIAGAYRAFEVGGTWASEATKPVVLNVKWEYQPQTIVILPFIVGFTSDGQPTPNNSGTRFQKIDVAWRAAFGDATPRSRRLRCRPLHRHRYH